MYMHLDRLDRCSVREAVYLSSADFIDGASLKPATSRRRWPCAWHT